MGGDKLVPMVAGQAVEDDLGDTLRELWTDEYEQLLPEIHLLQGARDFILSPHERGLKVALASSGKKPFTDHVIELLDLPAGVLGTVITSEDAQESKPQPSILQVALDGVSGAGAVLVGDTPYDVASAARMGAPCVVVRSGGYGVQELEASGAVCSWSTVRRTSSTPPGTTWCAVSRRRAPKIRTPAPALTSPADSNLDRNSAARSADVQEIPRQGWTLGV